jgi:fructose-1,6-bisphosphatase/inositol monophosphatase family enzyme
MKPTIEVVVSPQGDIVIEAVGFKGADCEAATKFLEEALGVLTNKSRKPEYYQASTRAAQQHLTQ